MTIWREKWFEEHCIAFAIMQVGQSNAINGITSSSIVQYDDMGMGSIVLSVLNDCEHRVVVLPILSGIQVPFDVIITVAVRPWLYRGKEMHFMDSEFNVWYQGI